MGITHTKVSAVADGGDTTLVRPVDWNAAHVIELDYVAFTSPVSVTATTEGTANTVVTGSSVAYDGSTPIMVEFYSPEVNPQLTDGVVLTFVLFEDSTVVGVIAKARTLNGLTTPRTTIEASVRRTPTAGSKTHVVKAFTTSGTSTVGAGAGGTGALVAGFIRITKV